jgi:hypothetical protein
VNSLNILFLPINGTVCEDWLSFPISQNLYVDEWPLRDRALGFPLCHTDYNPQAPFSPYGSDTLAGLVDAALSDPTAGLDLLLEQQVKRLTDAFEVSFIKYSSRVRITHALPHALLPLRL